MKIEEFTPPTTQKYRLELTEDQLIGLGLLSFRYESCKPGESFAEHLPSNIKQKVFYKADETPKRTHGPTLLGVDWNA